MTKIKISGVIIPNDYQDVYDWIGWDATSARKVEMALADVEDDDVTVEINSGGGSVFAGSEIYTLLKSSDKNITVNIVGVAASAASVIAMAGDTVNMSPTAQMMIHNATMPVQGDYREMDHKSDFLKKTNQTLINAYKLKSGLDEKELKAMLDKETWFTPQDAKEKGLIDGIMFKETVQPVASFNDALLPVDVLNKIKSKMFDEGFKKVKNIVNKSAENDELAILSARLNLLKLKGDVKI